MSMITPQTATTKPAPGVRLNILFGQAFLTGAAVEFQRRDKKRTHQNQAGSSMTNLAPWGWLSLIEISPLCSSTMLWAMARPRPVPELFLEK